MILWALYLALAWAIVAILGHLTRDASPATLIFRVLLGIVCWGIMLLVHPLGYLFQIGYHIGVSSWMTGRSYAYRHISDLFGGRIDAP